MISGRGERECRVPLIRGIEGVEFDIQPHPNPPLIKGGDFYLEIPPDKGDEGGSMLKYLYARIRRKNHSQNGTVADG